MRVPRVPSISASPPMAWPRCAPGVVQVRPSREVAAKPTPSSAILSVATLVRVAIDANRALTAIGKGIFHRVGEHLARNEGEVDRPRRIERELIGIDDQRDPLASQRLTSRCNSE
jgi:hypothetical protein